MWRSVQTLKLLLFRPGALTHAFMRGRRLPYIAPLRLYLTLSLIMFEMIKGLGVELPRLTLDHNSLGLAYGHKIASYTKAGRPAAVTLFLNAQDEKPQGKADDFEVRDGIRHAMAAIGHVNHRWMLNVQGFLAEPEKIQSAHLQLLPLAWLLAYLPFAMRRVYGGSGLAAVGKWLVLITVHVLVIAFFTVIAELIAVVGGG
jgi:hypothetical protein